MKYVRRCGISTPVPCARQGSAHSPCDPLHHAGQQSGYVRGVAGRQQMVRVQIEDGFRTSSVDLRQRLPVRIDVFADQIAGAVILPDQRPAGTVDIMGGIAPGHLLGALVKAPKSKKQMEDIQEYLVSRDIFKRIYRFF